MYSTNPLQPIYQHRQTGTVMLIFLIVPIIILLGAMIPFGKPYVLPPVLFVLSILIFTMVIFSSLTVTVDKEQVTLYFGPRFFRKSFPLHEIKAMRPVRNPIFYGLGIHFIPGGMVYNVSGLDAVEIDLGNGRRARIGTDEPAALARAIEEARQGLV